jgi:hypothetical protein
MGFSVAIFNSLNLFSQQVEQTALSNSRNAVNFSSARTTNRFPVVAMRASNPDCSPRRIKS